MSNFTYTIAKKFSASCSHQLRGVGSNHPCGRVHGHNYVFTLHLADNEVDEKGMVLDYRELDMFKRWVKDSVDHRHLNNIMDDNPTAENIARWIYDKWAGRYRWIPMSGHAAGIYANTDDVSDPWFAPAGLNRGLITNIRKLAFNPNQASRDIMYKNGINPIVSFSGQGKVVWGQKTMLDKNSAFNRVNVRRLFIILEKAISTAVKYFLFEPNDTFTRLQLINMIEPFLRDVRSRRGIYDFLVLCDSTNNTPERIDRNELWADIYIKPTKAAEFIVLNFIATKSGASFTELVAAGSTPTGGV